MHAHGFIAFREIILHDIDVGWSETYGWRFLSKTMSDSGEAVATSASPIQETSLIIQDKYTVWRLDPFSYSRRMQFEMRRASMPLALCLYNSAGTWYMTHNII